MATTVLRPISVFLVDDHPIVRKGYRHLLRGEEHLQVADEAGSGEEALEKIPSVRPDLAFVDISMAGMDGLELTRRLNQVCPEVRVIVVSMHKEARYVESALEAGARGYIVKDEVNQVIAEAAREVMNGNRYLGRDLEAKMGRSTGG